MSQSVHKGQTKTIGMRIPVSEARQLEKEAHELGIPLSRLMEIRIAGNSKNLNTALVQSRSELGLTLIPNRVGRSVVAASAGVGTGALSYLALREIGVVEWFARVSGALVGLSAAMYVLQD